MSFEEVTKCARDERRDDGEEERDRPGRKAVRSEHSSEHPFVEVWHKDAARARTHRPHLPHFSFAAGVTMNGTTCSRPSNPERYAAAACWLGKGPMRTRYHVPRP